jgi:hypothetical protein
MRGPCRFAEWLRVGIALPLAILGFGEVHAPVRLRARHLAIHCGNVGKALLLRVGAARASA